MLRRLASVPVSAAARNVSSAKPAHVPQDRSLAMLRPADSVSRVASKSRKIDLPYTTPEEMLEVVMANLPNFDMKGLADEGKAYRCSPLNTACAKAVKLPQLPSKLGAAHLIESFQQMDLSGLVTKRVKPTAVFDFDNTLARGEVFFDFSQKLMQANAFPAANAERCAKLLERATLGGVKASSLAHLSTGEVVTKSNEMAHAGELSLGAAFYIYLCALTGMKMSTLTALAEDLFVNGVNGRAPYKTNVFDGAPEIVGTLKSKGVTSHIVTMGLAFIPRAGAKYVGIEAKNVHGYELEVHDGVVTGRAVDVRSFGKHRICDAKVPSRPLFSFGDSFDTDTPLLQRATVAAFVVDPNKAMREFMAAHPTDYTWLTFSHTAPEKSPDLLGGTQ